MGRERTTAFDLTRYRRNSANLAFSFVFVCLEGCWSRGRHLFATLPDLRPPPLQGKWWGTKVQITCQKVGHIRFVRSNPFPSSHVSGGWNKAMEKMQFSYVKRALSQVISLLVGGSGTLIRLEIE